MIMNDTERLHKEEDFILPGFSSRVFESRTEEIAS